MAGQLSEMNLRDAVDVLKTVQSVSALLYLAYLALSPRLSCQ